MAVMVVRMPAQFPRRKAPRGAGRPTAQLLPRPGFAGGVGEWQDPRIGRRSRSRMATRFARLRETLRAVPLDDLQPGAHRRE
jgi:hypothetical protein